MLQNGALKYDKKGRVCLCVCVKGVKGVQIQKAGEKHYTALNDLLPCGEPGAKQMDPTSGFLSM